MSGSVLRVEGLRVALRVAGSAEPELLRSVAAKLRSTVCEDLEVQVEVAS